MMAALKSEFRKLLSVKATYFVLIISLLLEILFAFYGDGIKATVDALKSSGYLANDLVNAVNAVSVFVGLAGVLLVANEYRHNTITYTLTASRSRTRVLLAKVLVVSVYAAIATVILAFAAPLLAALGLHVGGHHYVQQSVPVVSNIWHAAFYGWGFSMFGLMLAFIIRNQIGAIVALFALPSTVEPILGHIFSSTQNYLPFSLLAQVMQHNYPDKVDAMAKNVQPIQSYGHAALLFLIYLVVGWAVAWYLFIKRDAN